MADSPLTPGDVARNEAAKQSVILVFGLAGAVILLAIQRRMMGSVAERMEQMMPAPVRDEAARERAARAVKAEARWHRVARYCWRTDLIVVARWAHRQAERARKMQEA